MMTSREQVTEPRVHNVGRTLRSNPAWARLWVANAVGSAATAMVAFLTPLMILRSSGSVGTTANVATIASLIACVSLVPAGFASDIFDRRQLLIISSWVTSAIFVVAGIMWMHTRSWVAVAAGLVLAGALGSITTPAGEASLREIVDRSSLPTAKILNQLRSNILKLVSPFVAAGFYVRWGIASSLFALGALRAVEPILISRIKVSLGPASSRLTVRSRIRQLDHGFKLVFRSGIVRGFAVFASLSNCSSILVTTMLTLFLAQGEHGTQHVAALAAGGAISSIFGGACGLKLTKMFRPYQLVLFSSLWQVLSLAAAAFMAGSPYALIALFAISRFFTPAANASVGGLVMATSPEGAQGRISASLALGSISLQPVGVALGGLFASHHSSIAEGFALACIIFLAGILLLVKSGELRRAQLPGSW